MPNTDHLRRARTTWRRLNEKLLDLERGGPTVHRTHTEKAALAEICTKEDVERMIEQIQSDLNAAGKDASVLEIAPLVEITKEQAEENLCELQERLTAKLREQGKQHGPA